MSNAESMTTTTTGTTDTATVSEQRRVAGTTTETDATLVTVIANEDVPATVIQSEKRPDTNGVTTDAQRQQHTPKSIWSVSSTTRRKQLAETREELLKRWKRILMKMQFRKTLHFESKDRPSGFRQRHSD